MTDPDHPSGAVACSVLVPVLNEERHIADSVAAMLEQRFPGRLEFLLADGGSSDGTAALLRRLAQSDDRIRVLENPGGATPSGLNVALRHARGRWVARMDAHTRYPPEYLATAVERLERGDTRWVSGPQVAVGENPVSRAVAAALRSPLGRGGSRKWGAPEGPGTSPSGEYELDSGVFDGVWERATLLEYGGWDERWLRNQDSELAGRFLAAGERLVCIPAMGARYTPRGTITSLWRQYRQYGEYRAKTAARHPGTMRRSHLLPPGLVLTVMAAVGLPRRLRRPPRAALLLYLAALTAAGVEAAGESEPRHEAALVPVVLAVMHLAHGLGALGGALRYGAPAAAIAHAAGFHRLADRLAPAAQDVYAPSLTGGEPHTEGLRAPTCVVTSIEPSSPN